MSKPSFHLSSSYETQLILMVLTGMVLSILSSNQQIWACLGLILLVGLPHGATDAFLIWEQNSPSKKRALAGLTMYLGSLLLCFYIWLAATDLFWSVFFCASIVHFGFGDRNDTAPPFEQAHLSIRILTMLSKMMRGCAIVLTPFIYHFEETKPFLLAASTPAFCDLLQTFAKPIWLTCLSLTSLAVAWNFLRHRNVRGQVLLNLIEAAYYTLLFTFITPLVAFTLYFVCHHSLSHMIRIWRYKRNPTLLISTVICTLPVIGFTLYFAPHGASDVAVIATAVALTWIACLTFPHMFIVHRFPFPKETGDLYSATHSS